MTTPEPNEKQLLADIDALRGQFPQTQDLYREVCVLLFFRGHAGIKPKMTHKPKSNKEQRPYYSVNSLDVVN